MLLYLTDTSNSPIRFLPGSQTAEVTKIVPGWPKLRDLTQHFD
jgi:hypothetical protein